jgi:zinc/manganese transport system substrate-binding protein
MCGSGNALTSNNTTDPIRTRSPAPRVLLAIATCLVLIAAGCGGAAEESTDGTPTIVATTGLWADVVSNVTCNGLATVETLVPVGADPHAFEASLSDRGQLEDAEVVVTNGLGLEEGLIDTIDAVADGGTVVFSIGDQVGGDDPHVWFDPAQVSAALGPLAEQLIIAAALDRAAVEDCLVDYRAELDAVDTEIQELVAAIPADRRILVTSHDSLGYFADRYGFKVIGTVIPASSTLAESNPAQLEALAELIETTDVPAIFAESQHATDDADALAARLGNIEVVTLFTGSLGEPGSRADTYSGFLLTNAATIAQALSGTAAR